MLGQVVVHVAALLPMARLAMACPPLLVLAWPPVPWPALVVVGRCCLVVSMDLRISIALVYLDDQAYSCRIPLNNGYTSSCILLCRTICNCWGRVYVLVDYVAHCQHILGIPNRRLEVA